MQPFRDLYKLSFVGISWLNWIGHVNRMGKGKMIPLQARFGPEGG